MKLKKFMMLQLFAEGSEGSDGDSGNERNFRRKGS